jgi:flagellar protein FliT
MSPPDGEPLCAQAPAGPRLIHRYEAIAQASRCMLAAARRGDWAEVACIEEQCRRMIEQLKAAAAVETLGPADQRERIRLLRAILADDAEIRACAEPWLGRIAHLISSHPALGASGR